MPSLWIRVSFIKVHSVLGSALVLKDSAFLWESYLRRAIITREAPGNKIAEEN